MCVCVSVCVFKQYSDSLGFNTYLLDIYLVSGPIQALGGLQGGLQLWDYCHRGVSEDLEEERGWAMCPASEAGGPAHFLPKLPFQAASVLAVRLQGHLGM